MPSSGARQLVHVGFTGGHVHSGVSISTSQRLCSRPPGSARNAATRVSISAHGDGSSGR
eukprot:CAMPEP_0182847380 /NCGR_PEP_ID=MMETSP0006_2-20121128/28429_1 /TAXON_ID=97485 /ORGANISM="Prymnesium parvum, Strain Texoma1" /LENGTH=58 /DNA_ID=CAMNT_0024977713 /DNA_START=185 /DNA_END=358 /DNA_ORIENTATION=+